jgi:hypothetical protein
MRSLSMATESNRPTVACSAPRTGTQPGSGCRSPREDYSTTRRAWPPRRISSAQCWWGSAASTSSKVPPALSEDRNLQQSILRLISGARSRSGSCEATLASLRGPA